MSWKNFTQSVVENYCNRRGSRTFSLDDMYALHEVFERQFPDNLHVKDKIRQTLQYLRDDGVLTFVDNRGTYTLRSIELLEGEVSDENIVKINCNTPERKEYLIETFARDIGWVRQSKSIYGLDCMYEKCSNSFIKDNGDKYIEVHHIIPLCRGGEEGLWNLCVLCAHHHRMAHYADATTRSIMEKYLLKEAECRIQT